MTGSRLTIGIHFDLICPWCFIGKRELDRARERFAEAYPDVGVTTMWHPVQLLPEVPEQGLPFAKFYERRLGSAEAVRQRRQQIVLAARNAALDLDLERIERMPNTARAHRLLRQVATQCDAELYERLLERLFAAYFQLGEDIGDAATLHALAAEVGAPADGPIEGMPSRRDPAAASAVAGVPRFAFNESRILRGAQDAGLLLLAMGQAVQAPSPAAGA